MKILKIDELANFSQFEDLKGVWNGILNKSKDNEVFQTWEWLSLCWKHFGNASKLRILIAKDGAEIVGIAPLMVSTHNFFHFGRIAKIQFIGSPWSDYNNFILVREEKECLKLFLNYLIRDPSCWDYLQLTDICEHSLSMKILCQLYNDVPIKYAVINACPYISLPESTEAFLEKLSRKMRRNLRVGIRKLNRDYTVKIRTHVDFDDVEEAMNLFFRFIRSGGCPKENRGSPKKFGIFILTYLGSLRKKDGFHCTF